MGYAIYQGGILTRGAIAAGEFRMQGARATALGYAALGEGLGKGIAGAIQLPATLAKLKAMRAEAELEADALESANELTRPKMSPTVAANDGTEAPLATVANRIATLQRNYENLAAADKDAGGMFSAATLDAGEAVDAERANYPEQVLQQIDQRFARAQASETASRAVAGIAGASRLEARRVMLGANPDMLRVNEPTAGVFWRASDSSIPRIMSDGLAALWSGQALPDGLTEDDAEVVTLTHAAMQREAADLGPAATPRALRALAADKLNKAKMAQSLGKTVVNAMEFADGDDYAAGLDASKLKSVYRKGVARLANDLGGIPLDGSAIADMLEGLGGANAKSAAEAEETMRSLKNVLSVIGAADTKDVMYAPEIMKTATFAAQAQASGYAGAAYNLAGSLASIGEMKREFAGAVSLGLIAPADADAGALNAYNATRTRRQRVINEVIAARTVGHDPVLTQDERTEFRNMTRAFNQSIQDPSAGVVRQIADDPAVSQTVRDAAASELGESDGIAWVTSLKASYKDTGMAALNAAINGAVDGRAIYAAVPEPSSADTPEVAGLKQRLRVSGRAAIPAGDAGFDVVVPGLPDSLDTSGAIDQIFSAYGVADPTPTQRADLERDLRNLSTTGVTMTAVKAYLKRMGAGLSSFLTFDNAQQREAAQQESLKELWESEKIDLRFGPKGQVELGLAQLFPREVSDKILMSGGKVPKDYEIDPARALKRGVLKVENGKLVAGSGRMYDVQKEEPKQGTLPEILTDGTVGTREVPIDLTDKNTALRYWAVSTGRDPDAVLRDADEYRAYAERVADAGAADANTRALRAEVAKRQTGDLLSSPMRAVPFFAAIAHEKAVGIHKRMSAPITSAKEAAEEQKIRAQAIESQVSALVELKKAGSLSPADAVNALVRLLEKQQDVAAVALKENNVMDPQAKETLETAILALGQQVSLDNGWAAAIQQLKALQN